MMSIQPYKSGPSWQRALHDDATLVTLAGRRTDDLHSSVATTVGCERLIVEPTTAVAGEPSLAPT